MTPRDLQADAAPADATPAPDAPAASAGGPARRRGLDPGGLLAGALALAVVAAVGAGVWLLQPRAPVDGRPLGELRGFSFVAKATETGGETLEVRRDGRAVLDRAAFEAATPADQGFARIELSGTRLHVGGGPERDAVLYGWTGGAHCCITHFVVDGATGRLLGAIRQGEGDPASFVESRRPGAPRAVLVMRDDAAVHAYGHPLDARPPWILVDWRGDRFGLDLERMKAASPDGPPSWIAGDPAIVEATAAAAGPGDFAATHAARRGDASRDYARHVEALRAAMAAAALDPADPASFRPLVTFLDEQTYKGQAAAGVSAAIEALGAAPDGEDRAREAALAVALRRYFETLATSAWFDDLDRLNDGRLASLAARHAP